MGGVVAFGGALLAALVLTPVARRVAFATGVLDRPGPLKVHAQPIAYLGGVAVYAALAIVLLPTLPAWLVPLGMALVLGTWDDVRPIPPRLRLLLELAIGVVAGIVIPMPGLGAAGTALLTLALLNAVNLLDGMDGLAASVVAVSALGLSIVTGDARVGALALAGSLVGFLVFNWTPARIFLGDGGAYLLGTALALSGAAAVHHGGGASAWFALPFLVALPLADTAIAIARRQRRGKPLFAGDRSHVYDQLAQRGWRTERIVLACATAQAAATCVGVIVWTLGPLAAMCVAALAFAVAGAAVQRVGFVTGAAA